MQGAITSFSATAEARVRRSGMKVDVKCGRVGRPARPDTTLTWNVFVVHDEQWVKLARVKHAWLLAVVGLHCAASPPAAVPPEAPEQIPPATAPTAQPHADVWSAATSNDRATLAAAAKTGSGPLALAVSEALAALGERKAPFLGRPALRLARPPFEAQPAGAARARVFALQGTPTRVTPEASLSPLSHLYVTTAGAHDAPFVDATRGSAAPPTDWLQEFGSLGLALAIGDHDDTLLLYGEQSEAMGFQRVRQQGRLLAVVQRSGALRALFDLSDWMVAPKARSSGIDLIVRWARVVGDTLYLSNSHGDRPRVSGGQDAYLSAVELATGKLLWRSPPRVADGVFLVLDEVLVSSVDDHDKARSELVVTDRASGRVLSRKDLPFALHQLDFAADGAVVAEGQRSALRFAELRAPAPTASKALPPAPTPPAANLALATKARDQVLKGELAQAIASVDSLEASPDATTWPVLVVGSLLRGERAKQHTACLARLDATKSVIVPRVTLPPPASAAETKRLVLESTQSRGNTALSYVPSPSTAPLPWRIPDDQLLFLGGDTQREAIGRGTSVVFVRTGTCEQPEVFDFSGWGTNEMLEMLGTPGGNVRRAFRLENALVVTIDQMAQEGRTKTPRADLVAFDPHTGALLWHGPPITSGFTVGVAGDVVLMERAPGRTLFALDATNGRLLGKAPMDYDLVTARPTADGALDVWTERFHYVARLR